jgi:hypothetical protein
VAKPSPYSKANPPSAWAIVIVAAVLILLPVLFCGIVVLTRPSTSSTGQGPAPELKRPDMKP